MVGAAAGSGGEEAQPHGHPLLVGNSSRVRDARRSSGNGSWGGGGHGVLPRCPSAAASQQMFLQQHLKMMRDKVKVTKKLEKQLCRSRSVVRAI